MNSKEKMDSMKHHRVVVTRHGGPDVLQVVEEDLPEPGPGEVRVKVLAAGVSAYDLMFRRSGLLPGTPRVPFTLGEDVVGVVDKLGEGVSTFEPGQTVAGATWALGLLVAAMRSSSACPPASWCPFPSDVDPAEAVCLVVNYLTAYMAMHRTAKRAERRAHPRPRCSGRHGERPARARQAGRAGDVRHGVQVQSRARINTRSHADRLPH